MSNRNLGFLLALLFAASMWFYIQHVAIARQMSEAARLDTPRGNLSDLYPRWLGARELLLHHRDPYSAEITREIQMGYYGRPLDPQRSSDPQDQQAFAYPVYVVFLLAPTIEFPFPAVQTGLLWLLVGCTIAGILLWLRALGWSVSCIETATIIIFTLGSFPILQGIKLQQLSLLVGGLLAASAFLLVRNHLFLPGVLLALATIKPQLVVPLAGCLVLWALGDWRGRQKLVWGFALTLAALFAAGEYVLPGWVGRFRDALVAYRQYTGGAESILDVLLTPKLGPPVAALLLPALAWWCWRHRHAPQHSEAFRAMLVLILAVTVVVVPKTAPYNQVLLVPAILFLAERWRFLWSRSPMLRGVSLLAGSLILWPWLAALGLALASIFLPASTVQEGWTLPIATSLAIPPVVAALLAILIHQSPDLQG